MYLSCRVTVSDAVADRCRTRLLVQRRSGTSRKTNNFLHHMLRNSVARTHRRLHAWGRTRWQRSTLRGQALLWSPWSRFSAVYGASPVDVTQCSQHRVVCGSPTQPATGALTTPKTFRCPSLPPSHPQARARAFHSKTQTPPCLLMKPVDRTSVTLTGVSLCGPLQSSVPPLNIVSRARGRVNVPYIVTYSCQYPRRVTFISVSPKRKRKKDIYEPSTR
jgi:hypothetical protein